MNSKRKIRLIIYEVLMAFVTSTGAWATTYYVDATGGDDSNAGNSIDSPWKTISRVNDSHFQPGDSILLKRGEEWREELFITSSGLADAPITYGAYGEENIPKPIINGADVISQWSEYSQNIWWTSLLTGPFLVWFDEERGKKVGSIEELQQEKDWCWNDNDLLVYSTADPSTIYLKPGVEVANRKSCIKDNHENRSYIVIENFHLKHSGTRDDYYGAIDCRSGLGENWIIKNCDIIEIASMGILLLYDNSKVLNSNILHCRRGAILLHQDNTNSETSGNHIAYCESGITFFGHSFLISGNKIHHNTWNGIFGRHLYDRPNTTNNKIIGNEIFENGQGLQEWLRRDPSQRDVTNFDGLWVGNMDSSVIAYNLVYNNQYGHGIHLDDGCEYNLVANNVVYGHLDNGTIRYACGLVIEHGTDAYTGKCEVSLYNRFVNNIVYNNYCQIGLAGIKPECNNMDYSSNIFDYNNLAIGPQGENIGWDCFRDHTSLDTWQAATGQDANSISIDPKFLSSNPNKPMDFRLQENSPCKNAGLNVGLHQDFFGNPIIGLPEIGFYEIQKQSQDFNPPASPKDVRVKKAP